MALCDWNPHNHDEKNALANACLLFVRGGLMRSSPPPFFLKHAMVSYSVKKGFHRPPGRQKKSRQWTKFLLKKEKGSGYSWPFRQMSRR